MLNPNADNPSNQPPDYAGKSFDEHDDYSDDFGQPLTPEKIIVLEQKVEAAAARLILVGWFCVNFSLISFVCCDTDPLVFVSNLNICPQPAFRFISLVFGLVYFGCMIYGAHCMSNFHSWSWSLTATGLGALTLLLCVLQFSALNLLCGALSTPLGVRAFWLLNQPDVRDEFRRRRTERTAIVLPENTESPKD